MRKYLSLLFVLFIALFLVSGCSKATKDGKKFKEEYESINGKENAAGKKHRSLDIDEKNPFVYATAEEIVEMVKDKKTFYVYFGDPLCPWCRSVLEKFIEVAKEEKIDKVYYVKIWDDEGSEVLRNKYELDSKGKAKETIKGTDAYYELLKKFDKVLSDYNLTDEDGNKVDLKQKRIYAPNFIYVKKGKVIAKAEGISEKQKDSREELTDALLKDEEKLFKDFFAK